MDRISLYKSIWKKHWRGFLSIYNERFLKIYGPITAEKKFEVKKLLGCGNFKNGFQIHKCPQCGTILAVPFSCKSRLCLSCYRKKIFVWSINLSNVLNTSLSHIHVTFTMPGKLSHIMKRNNFNTELLIKLAAMTYQKEMRKRIGDSSGKFSAGMLGTIHKSGNGLNYNPHIHLISTRELVNVKTGKTTSPIFIQYRKFRVVWMDALLKFLLRKKCISKEEFDMLKSRHPDGFHVYLQPIPGGSNDVLYSTAEYLADGYFHNSQIVEVNHHKMTVSFRYRRWVNRKTGEKFTKTKAIGIYDFMALMLYYLPDPHMKIIRYYGLYAMRNVKPFTLERKNWAKGIQHCFGKNPELCPHCGNEMSSTVIYSAVVDRYFIELLNTHMLYQGYFYRRRAP